MPNNDRTGSPTPRKAGQYAPSSFEIFDSGSSSSDASSIFDAPVDQSISLRFPGNVPLTTSRGMNQQRNMNILGMPVNDNKSQGRRLNHSNSWSPQVHISNGLSNTRNVSENMYPNVVNSLSALGIVDRSSSGASTSRSQGSDRNALQECTQDIHRDSEVTRLRKELDAAQSKIAVMDQELTQNRITQHTINQALGSPELPVASLGDAFYQAQGHVRDSYANRSDSDMLANNAIDQFGTISPSPWSDASRIPSIPSSYGLPYGSTIGNHQGWNTNVTSGWNKSNVGVIGAPTKTNRQGQRRLENTSHVVDGVPLQTYGGNIRHDRVQGGIGPGSAPMSSGFSSSAMPIVPTSHMSQALAPYPARGIGTILSPTAIEFNADGGGNYGAIAPFAGGWHTNGLNSENIPSQPYMHATEPMNYRRLLDKGVTCNWKYIVDKIVCNNDQQASIFLQQKLKIASAEQKFDIVEAIIAQAYPLMVNRFGNFLVQRCFEHGNEDQIIAIADAIRGNTLNLSMDAFGCHVVQKAFDVVPEEYKAIMVHELLRRIPETVIHRYACHVWQKLFELRWSDAPPQIMRYVNEALDGMWDEVALGETGSLVVQNIFENCLDEDKRACIREILDSIDAIARGQFGNWCIQHICEHGAPADKSFAIEHVLLHATDYSTDQFASKVVEKCLKVCGSDFVDRYLERVCEGRADRPRMPLIDIAGDQYGNYLIQYILIHTESHQKEIVAQHIRKHMVSLRGSKFGSRVAMLCGGTGGYTSRPHHMGGAANRTFANSYMSHSAAAPFPGGLPVAHNYSMSMNNGSGYNGGGRGPLR